MRTVMVLTHEVEHALLAHTRGHGRSMAAQVTRLGRRRREESPTSSSNESAPVDAIGRATLTSALFDATLDAIVLMDGLGVITASKSLRHILELSPRFVKLDMGLVRGVDTDAARQALIAGVVHFANETGCVLVAEGVETEAERRALRRLGVTFGQGYLLGRPAPAEDLAGPART